jgi:hypothetical protein
VLAVRLELVAPRERPGLEAAARGKLPFGLGRQPLARPRAVGERVGVRDMQDGVVEAVVE